MRNDHGALVVGCLADAYFGAVLPYYLSEMPRLGCKFRIIKVVKGYLLVPALHGVICRPCFSRRPREILSHGVSLGIGLHPVHKKIIIDEVLGIPLGGGGARVAPLEIGAGVGPAVLIMKFQCLQKVGGWGHTSVYRINIFFSGALDMGRVFYRPLLQENMNDLLICRDPDKFRLHGPLLIVDRHRCAFSKALMEELKIHNRTDASCPTLYFIDIGTLPCESLQKSWVPGTPCMLYEGDVMMGVDAFDKSRELMRSIEGCRLEEFGNK